MKELKIEELKKYFEGLQNTYIVNFAEMKNGSFTDYKYFTIERNGYYFYIEENEYNTWTFAPITITAYKKIDFWHKIQCSYPIGAYSKKDVLNYINNTIKKQKKPLKDVYKQRNLDFEKYKKQNEKEYKNIFERLNLGYREKEILKNIEHVEMIQNDGTYKVYKIYNSKNDYIKIELNSCRIVG